MIDHIGLAVSSMERAKAFYSSALRPLGIGVIAGSLGGGNGRRRPRRLRQGPQGFLLDRHGKQAQGRRARRLHGGNPRRGRCLPPGGDGRRGQGQWRAWPQAPLPQALLRRLRPRPRRQQHRSRVPQAGVKSATGLLRRGIADFILPTAPRPREGTRWSRAFRKRFGWIHAFDALESARAALQNASPLAAR